MHLQHLNFIFIYSKKMHIISGTDMMLVYQINKIKNRW